MNDDLEFDANEELGDIEGANAKIKKLREQLKEAHAQRDEYLDGWQRCKADSINTKRETAALLERTGNSAREGLIEELLPVIDSFDMATGTPAWESLDENWRAGMDQVRNQLLDVLSRAGVERYGTVGSMYDPHIHEAVQQMDDVPGEPGSIVRILRFGYRTKERVIRPAQVIIKSGPHG